MISGDKASTVPPPEVRARVMLEQLDAPSIDVVAAAKEARAIFVDMGDARRGRWLDLEIDGYGALSDVHPLHEVLGLSAGDPLAAEVAAYRTQVGRRWESLTEQDQLAHFFVDPLAELAAARDRVRTANVIGLVELSFARHPSVPEYPRSAEFPVDVFDRILLGFTAALKRELRGLAP